MKRILFLDDDVFQTKYHVDELKKTFEVERRSDVDRALYDFDKIRKEKGDWAGVVLDMMMPPGQLLGESPDGIRTGWYVFRKLRQMQSTLPIIVLSNFDATAVKEWFRDEKNVDVFDKVLLTPLRLVETARRMFDVDSVEPSSHRDESLYEPDEREVPVPDRLRRNVLELMLHDLKHSIGIILNYTSAFEHDHGNQPEVVAAIVDEAKAAADGIHAFERLVLEERLQVCNFVNAILEPIFSLFQGRFRGRLLCHTSARNAPSVRVRPAAAIVALLWLFSETHTDRCVCEAETSSGTTIFVLTLSGPSLRDPASLGDFREVWRGSGLSVELRAPSGSGAAQIVLSV